MPASALNELHLEKFIQPVFRRFTVSREEGEKFLPNSAVFPVQRLA